MRALVNGELTVEVDFDTDRELPGAAVTFRAPRRGGAAGREPRALLVAGRARLHRQPLRRLRDPPAVRAPTTASGSTAWASARTAGSTIKGLALDLVQRNAEVTIPFVLSQPRLRLPVEQPRRRPRRVRATTPPAGRPARRARSTTGSPRRRPRRQILARYADATGHAPELPAWASGFWQCKLRYRTQDELLEVAREHKRRGLPLSVIVADFFHWSAMGDYRFDAAEWPDPEAMVDELRRAGRRADGLDLADGLAAVGELRRVARPGPAGRQPTRASSSTRPSGTRAWPCRCRSPSTTPPTRAPASSSGS